MSDSADKIVAERIVAEFQKKDFIRESGPEDFARRLSSGNLSVGDWRRMAEPAIEERDGGKSAQ